VSSSLLELVLVIVVSLGVVAYVRRVISADPEQRRSLLTSGLIIMGGCCILGAGVLFVIAETAATQDLGSTWSNTGAHDLILPMIICVVAGLMCFVGAWRVRPRR
jgi:O-antigen/teichoic acid export membrane protein